MHLKSVRFHPDRYPTREHYPFQLDIFHQTSGLDFTTPVTLFVGENGTGKSTLLEAIARVRHLHLAGRRPDPLPREPLRGQALSLPLRRVDQGQCAGLVLRLLHLPGLHGGMSRGEHCIGPVRTANQGHRIEVGFQVGSKAHQVYFQSNDAILTPHLEAFLACAFLPCMKKGGSLVAAGEASHRFLAAVPTITAVFRGWGLIASSSRNL